MLHSRLKKGLRAVALFEVAKGLIGLWIACRLLTRGKVHVLEATQWLMHHLHLDPAEGFGKRVWDFVNHINDGQILMLTGLAFAYTAIRGAEAYGLWRERSWAEWFAVLSAGLYIPVELMEVILRTTWLKVMLLSLNVGVVAFLVKVLMEARKMKAGKAQAIAPSVSE